MVNQSGGMQGYPGIQPPSLRPDYAAYRSPHGPQYSIQSNWKGLNMRSAKTAGTTLGLFGATAGIFALFFFSDIPRVKVDIMQKIPILGDHYKKEIPPEDNPF